MNHNASSAVGAALSKLKVLLVDDDRFILDLLREMLGQMGITQVSIAVDGQCGASLIGKGAQQPDLVICDIEMPGKDGFQVMQAMAAQDFRGGVIVLSGMELRVLNSAALMGRFHHLKVLGVLAKPVSRGSLGELLVKLLNERESSNAA